MAEGNTDPAGINPGNESHQKSHAHKSRRGRFRHSNDENLSSQQYGHFNQGFRSQFGQNGSNYTRQQHPHHQDDNLSRRRGRGRREVSRSANGSFFSQTPGEEHSKYTDNRSVEGPDAANWRREPDRNIEQTNVEQEGQPKKPRKYSQEQKARRPNEKGPRPKEDNAKDEGQWSNHAKAESPLDVRERTHGKREEGPDLQYEEQSRKRPEMKRRQGPIKPAKPLYQEERGPDVEAGGGQESSRNSHNAFRTGRGSGRYTSSQPRGGRRTHPQSQRPSQRNWDKVPESKETQTGCLIEQLSEEKYECMVCCDVIRHMAPVWSCQSCFHVFHLNCIKKWARSPASQADDSNEGWRCPACQNVALKHPTSYTCFCGKVINPEWHHSEIPHSCGNMCGKKRGGLDCNHPCNILCHPGPCPQCPAFITKSCVCGKTSQPVRCGQGAVLKCNRECGALLNCADHTCAQVCHSGTCQPCQLQVQQTCYCGVTTRQALCGTDREALNGSGYFCCQKICGKMLNCGAHRCQQVCHSGQCQPCSRSPSLVKMCPCGQTPLVKLMELGYSERQSCSDPIPSCGKTCSKPLACGSNDSIHLCEKLCHEGSCGPCSLTSTIKCRCGSKTMDVPCATIHSEAELVFACERRCNKKRSCGRHKCGELCCVNLDHKCVMICGYKLNCGLHRCQETCHRGNCEPCWQSSFDELTCHCGLTILYPPIACGTKPPECKNVCTRRHECEHPVLHNCHGDEKCPPCTHLTQKWCMGKHEQRSNIPCHLQDISCGLTCNKTLPCGGHRCKKICHRGDCVGEGGCRQPCMQPRLDCGHPCSAPCHQGSSCPRTSCSAKVALQCDCGRRKETVICSEAASSHQKYAAIAMASKLSDMQLGDSMDMGPLLTKKEMKQARLECDQECATLERNRRLAEALQISSFSDPFNTRANSVYSDSLKEDARRDLKFVSEVEGEIRNLVELANKGKQPKRSHCFPAMNREHRRIIHELAEVYGVESVSYDSEPKRNVVVTAQKGKGACPSSTLTLVIERETSTRAPPPIAHIKQQTSKVAGGSTRSKMAKEEPVIDYFDVQD